RARIVGRPVYAESSADAIAAIEALGANYRDRVVVEDPTRPIEPGAGATGTARIVKDLPEQVVIETISEGPAYLVLSDTFDPGWSATLDGQLVPIRPAFVAFRAVALPAGSHTVEFTYRPAGFELGIWLVGAGLLFSLFLLVLPWQ